MKDADQKQEKDERVRNCMAEIRDVAYEAEICRRISSFKHFKKGWGGKRYLVVLDDIIWGNEVWVSLKPAFPKGKEGSKVSVTTLIECLHS
jgi:hypothetical protein